MGSCKGVNAQLGYGLQVRHKEFWYEIIIRVGISRGVGVGGGSKYNEYNIKMNHREI